MYLIAGGEEDAGNVWRLIDELMIRCSEKVQFPEFV